MVKPIREIFRNWAVLDADGRHVNGTDKESNHRYGDTYETLFQDRDTVYMVMEVGVADGACLCAWREVFPNALIVGMDIHPAANWNGEFHLGDQRSQQDCEWAAAGRFFDLIVEDAVHSVENSLLTLFWLWPYIKPGGLYVIEEFANIGAVSDNVLALLPNVKVLRTVGPSGGVEPLVVLRKV